LALIMCDVDCGSETVGMVKKLSEWRNQNSDVADRSWGQLQAAQEELAACLSEKKPEKSVVNDLAESFKKLRSNLQSMTEQSGVPVEPIEQTKLLDALTDGVEGVIGGVVPGAGGYDAITLLIRDDEETMRGIKTVLEKWSAENGGSNVKLLGVKGEMEGVRSEDVDTGSLGYGDWIEWK